MKKQKKNLLVDIYFIIAFICLVLIIPNVSNAWDSFDESNLAVSNIITDGAKLKGFDIEFTLSDSYEERITQTCNCCLILQTTRFYQTGGTTGNGDFTNLGNICAEYKFNSFAEVLSDSKFCKERGIVYALPSDGTTFNGFGDYSTITKTLSNLDINTNTINTYYLYLWVDYEGIYPEVLIGTVEVSFGDIMINGSSEKTVATVTDSREVIKKVEIENANLELKVDERPTFSSRIKDNSDIMKLDETFMALNRMSTLSADEEVYSDEDGLVKDYKYFHIIDLTIAEDANFKFDDTTKVYINGVEKEIAYLPPGSAHTMTIANEGEVIIPEGYVEPAELDEDFARAQRVTLEKIILQAIKDGKVKYNDEETEEIVQEALENGKEVYVEFEVSETISKNQARYYFIDEDAFSGINSKIGEGQKLGAYYIMGIIVYVDGDWVGYIAEIETPLSVTVPLPNGLPKLDENYERIWKVIRYHDGIAEVIDAKCTDNGISFENGKFSEFAAIYEDVKIEKTGKAKAEEQKLEEKAITDNTTNDENLGKSSSNPKTGDNIRVWISLMIISMLGVAVTTKFTKNRK